MARSHRHTPIAGNAVCRSEKDDKRAWHGSLRARERACLDTGDYERLHDRDHREVSDIWDMGKDGKRWFDAPWPELMRK